jgi:hypothetical protein
VLILGLLAEKIQAETRRGVKQEEIQPGSEFFSPAAPFFLLLQIGKIRKCDFFTFDPNLIEFWLQI